MPFQSEKQRRFLHANHPEIAKRWERDYATGGISNHFRKRRGFMYGSPSEDAARSYAGTHAGEIAAKGVFVFVGIVPNTEFLKDLVEMDESGYIITDENMQTRQEGIFACGDARKKLLRQVVTACGEGATAAFSAQHHVEELKGVGYK